MKCSAVILAGGSSRRMGRDKAWLEVAGEPLLSRQVALAKAAGATEVWISGRPQADYSSLGCPVLVDAWAGCGPLAGIERALAVAGHNLVLVLAVDLPHLGPSLLQSVLSECAEEVGVVPRHGQSLEPLVAVYPKSAHLLALARLRAQRYAARGFAEACRQHQLVKVLPVPEGLSDFTNRNRPEEQPLVRALGA